MNILFRVDGSYTIGSGHVMRCLTLAEHFRKTGNRVMFVIRDLEGGYSEVIKKHDFDLYILKGSRGTNDDTVLHSDWLEVSWEKDAYQTVQVIDRLDIEIDWIIVDHYAIDFKWEVYVGMRTRSKFLIIDDLADRKHNCHILIDQNYSNKKSAAYQELVPRGCQLLLGPNYAIIREEFLEERKRKTKKKIFNGDVLVFFGGSDSTEETLKLIDILKEMNINKQRTVHVVVGRNNKHKEHILNFCRSNLNFVYHYDISYMAKLLGRCAFSICAGGSFTWERYCLGVPAIVIAVAYNQVDICEEISCEGIDCYLGQSNEINKEDVVKAIRSYHLIDCSNRSELAMSLVDGLGKKRIAKHLNNPLEKGCFY